MAVLAEQYPYYGGGRNAAYPTKGHIVALLMHGVTRYHRTSFAPVRKMLSGL